MRVACLADTRPSFPPSASKLRAQAADGGCGDAGRNNYYDWWRALLLTPGFHRRGAELTEARRAAPPGDGPRRTAATRRRSNLPYGEQRRLEIARALARGPKVLLLDEPAAGMNTREKAELMVLIRELRDEFELGILRHRARHEAGDGHLRAASPCSTTARPSPPARRSACAATPRSSRRTWATATVAAGAPSSAAGHGTERRAACRRPSRSSRWRSSTCATAPSMRCAASRSRSAGEVVALIGANGAGKTTHPARGERHAEADERAHHARRARTSPGMTAHLAGPAGHGARARGARHLPQPHRARRTWSSARTCGGTTPRWPSGPEKCLRAFPASSRSGDADGAARSRAASSRCWPSRRALMSRPQAAAAGRAVAWASRRRWRRRSSAFCAK